MKWLLLSFLVAQSAGAWDNTGHRVVAQLAETQLSPIAQAKLKLILGKESLADLANWADWIKSDPQWQHAWHWHFLSVEDGKSYDPKDASKSGDVIDAIQRFSRELADAKMPPHKRREAVAFLVHFVGDIHMPLHVGRAADQGGNKIELNWFGSDTNLHSIWDNKLIQMENLSYTEYAKLLGKTSEAQRAEWAKTPLMGWAEESMALRELVYSYPEKREKGWEWAYRFKALPVVHLRMQQAGTRLATLLNGIFRQKLKK